MGAAMLVAAPLYKASGSGLSVVWLAEAEALFLVGVLTREIVFRHLGALAALLTAGHMLAVDAWAQYELRAGSGAEPPAFRLALLFGATMLVFYVNAHSIGRRRRELFTTDLERGYLLVFSYVAAALAFVGAWLAWPGWWLGVAWGALALLLAFAGSRLALEHLSIQAHFFGVAAFVWGAAHNLETTASLHGVSMRVLALGLVAALLYASVRWARFPFGEDARAVSALYTSGGSLLVALLAWKELPWAWTAVAWAAFALVLLLVGRWLGRNDLRWQAHAAAAAALVRALAMNLEAGSDWHGVSLRLTTLLLIAALFYLSSRWSGLRDPERLAQIPAAYTSAGTLLIAVLSWKELSTPWTAVAWAAFGLLLLVMGRGMKRRELPYQAIVLFTGAFAWTLLNNFSVTSSWHGFTLRLLTVSVVAVLFYLAARWAEDPAEEGMNSVAHAYTWAASLLVAVLIWYELQPASVALGWALFGLVLFELGFARLSTSLRLQAYTLLAASFIRLFIANLNAESAPGELSPRLFTILPLVLAYYFVYARLRNCPEDGFAIERRRDAAGLFNYFGAVTVAALMRFELSPDWVVAGWAALVLILLAMAAQSKQTIYLHQGLLLCVAVAFRTAFHNFMLPQYYPPGEWQRPAFTVGSAAALLFFSLPFAFRLRAQPAEAAGQGRLTRIARGVVRRPEQALFFLPLALITVLLTLEVRRGLLTVSWGVEGVLVFLVALWAGERSYRLSGLALLMLCVGKIVFIDVWERSGSDRYLTFIILGAALLLVSYLYTRFREKLRRYL